MTNKEYNATTEKFTRGDVAVISYRALSLRKKGTSVNILGGIVESRVPDYRNICKWDFPVPIQSLVPLPQKPN